ncbi:hypothetical protein RHSIM_Rhsim12G0010800 [Rhododendron simsii]|uniref:Anaphase-promoting complex subunit 5 n=1 Tax=Rhododendron simsii TaxID=118357 RepID=A0A834L989_RHOSS|nr:hypothetical protein RHSIM_Rhsim12G0010800 [Rhododendron simsii]
MSSPDDLFNFFTDLRGILGGPDSGVVDDDQTILDPNSNLGMYIRRCLLSFGLLSFEELHSYYGSKESRDSQFDSKCPRFLPSKDCLSLGLAHRLAITYSRFKGVCHLLTHLGIYCKEALSSSQPYESLQFDDSSNDREGLLEYENMDLEDFVYEKVTEEIEERKRANEMVPFHNHAPKALTGLVEVEVLGDDSLLDVESALISLLLDVGSAIISSLLDVECMHYFEVSAGAKLKHGYKPGEVGQFAYSPSYALKGVDPSTGVFLRTNLQIQGYLLEQADEIEKNGSSFPLNAFESILKQIQKLAPELHRVHFLRYLNSLYHDDYPAALENLHRYFDYSAGTEGFDFGPPSSSGCNSFGRYEIALLCLGMMHFHFGHPRQALEVLTEAVQVSQQHNDDTCLAYTLAAICNLLSEVGISGTSGILGTSYSPGTHIGTSLSIQQQLLVLLRRSLKRAESLKLKRLVALNHVSMAKFYLTHVQMPMLSFGPKASMKLRTCPITVCKELRLSSDVFSEFSSENSTMIIDGAFSTAWLKNFQKSTGPSVFSQDNGSGSKSDALHFCALPSSIPGSVLQLLGSSYLVRATAWEMYGSSPLAKINALVYATCFADSSSSADAALAYTKLVQHLAVFKGYQEAFAAFKIAEEMFLSVSKSRILILKLQLLHERALHWGHLKLAHQLCDELGVLASSVTGVDVELKTEASLRRARTLLAAKQFSQAAAVAHSLFCMCHKLNKQVENAMILLLLAEIHKRSGNAVLGIPCALASLSFCQSFNLDLLKASATLTLAELWLSLGSNHAKRASTLVHRSLPMILGHGGLELRARAFIAEAKCYLADPSFSVFEDSQVVLDPLSQAAEELQYLEYHELAAEAYYLMAIVFDALGQLEHREEVATSFRKHMIALENPQEQEDPLSSIL